jgi:hypothetical protein
MNRRHLQRDRDRRDISEPSLAVNEKLSRPFQPASGV